MSSYGTCPICLESDARIKDDGDHRDALIHCVNHSCGSNGGDNFEGVRYRFYNEAIMDAAKVICGDCARGIPIQFQRHQTLPPSAAGGSYPCVALRITALKVNDEVV